MFRGAGFPRAIFEGPVSFEDARLGHALFAHAKFQAEANFKNVRFYTRLSQFQSPEQTMKIVVIASSAGGSAFGRIRPVRDQPVRADVR